MWCRRRSRAVDAVLLQVLVQLPVVVAVLQPLRLVLKDIVQVAAHVLVRGARAAAGAPALQLALPGQVDAVHVLELRRAPAVLLPRQLLSHELLPLVPHEERRNALRQRAGGLPRRGGVDPPGPWRRPGARGSAPG